MRQSYERHLSAWGIVLLLLLTLVLWPAQNAAESSVAQSQTETEATS